MTNALALDSREILLEVHRFLRDLDPARFRDELWEAARQRADRLSRALRELAERHQDKPGLRERLDELRHLLEERVPQVGLSLAERKAAFAAWYEGLKPAYEAVAAGMRDYRVHVPSLRPTNYARNAFHVAWALFALFLIEGLLTVNGLLYAAGGFAVYAWTTELTRRAWPRWNELVMKLYGRVAHPHEWHRINSATWYATALVGLALTRSPLLCAMGVAVLGFGDPAAALIGRRFGRVKLVNGRSLEGSIAFVVFGAAVAAPLAVVAHGFGWPAAIGVALGASTVGAVAELFSRRVDDNLTIPLAAALGAALACVALGVPF